MAENERMGREPIQIVEIDQDFCNNTYGVLPCQASLVENLIWHSENMDDPDGYWDTNTNVIIDYVGAPVVEGKTLGEIRNDDSPITDSAFVSRNVAYNNTIPSSSQDLSMGFVFKRKSLGDPVGEVGQVRISIATANSVENKLQRDVQCYFNPDTGVLNATVEPNPSDFFLFEFRWEAIDADYAKASITCRSANAYVPDSVDFLFGLDPINEGGANRANIFMGGFQLNYGSELAEYVKTTNQSRFITGTDKCFNTRSTCQDPANYDKGTLTLKFVNKQSPAPVDDYYIPSLRGQPNVTPAKLNPGGADKNARALGQRASINVSFLDHPHNDRLVDLYRDERTYDPLERGTFWTKWRARNPYYMQRPIRLVSGYFVDGQVVEPITRDFVITGFSGPDNQGNVAFKGKDILTLAEDDKAQAPVASNGKLSADLAAGVTSATLEPAGIGDAEYDASGFVRVGKEVMAYTRTGDDLTLTRGQFGTEDTIHDEGDTVQKCLRYVSQPPQDILFDLLNVYAGIPAANLDKAQWDAEALDFLPRLYTAIITEPEGVSKLISEMCQQMYFTIWWDERIGKVVMQAVRLAQEDEVFELNDDRHLVRDSISWRDLSEELVTQVWVYYGQIDPTDKVEQGSNYSAVAITADPTAEGADKHNLRRVKNVFSRWIDATNATAAEDLGRQILTRYGNAPRQATFRVDAKDDYLWLGNFIRLTNRSRTNVFGESVPVNLQIFEAQEKSLGSEYQFTAQEFVPALIGDESVGDPNERVIPITSSLLNVNLRTLHDALFGAPDGTETVTFVIRAGVVVGGDAAGGGVNIALGQRVTANDFYDAGSYNNGVVTAQIGQLQILQRAGLGSVTTYNPGDTYAGIDAVAYKVVEYPASTAMRTGTWPAGVTLKLIIESGAGVIGEGGNGSAHLFESSPQSIRGGDGGDALLVEYDIEITNGGTVAGGGAGGFSSGDPEPLTGEFVVSSGGGGAGLIPSSIKGNILVGPSFYDFTIRQNRIAANGDTFIAGQGGLLDYRVSAIDEPITGPGQNFVDKIYEGGAGGGLAEAGNDGRRVFDPDDSAASTTPATSTAVTVAGKAVSAGTSQITWVNKGDVRGDEVI